MQYAGDSALGKAEGALRHYYGFYKRGFVSVGLSTTGVTASEIVENLPRMGDRIFRQGSW